MDSENENVPTIITDRLTRREHIGVLNENTATRKGVHTTYNVTTTIQRRTVILQILYDDTKSTTTIEEA